MNSRLLVVADLGRLKAYRLDESERFSHPRLTLLEEWETGVARHLSEDLTDRAGRFRKGSSEGPSALSDGEQHNLDLERRRRAVKAVAQHISELIQREQPEACYLAADNRINQPILDELDAVARSRIEKNLATNLSRLDPDKIIRHFCE